MISYSYEFRPWPDKPWRRYVWTAGALSLFRTEAAELAWFRSMPLLHGEGEYRNFQLEETHVVISPEAFITIYPKGIT